MRKPDRKRPIGRPRQRLDRALDREAWRGIVEATMGQNDPEYA